MYSHFIWISEQLVIFTQNNHFYDSISPGILFWPAHKDGDRSWQKAETWNSHACPTNQIAYRKAQLIHHDLCNSTQTEDWWATALTVMLPHMRWTAIWSQGETWFATSTFEFSSLTSLFSSFTRMPNTIHKECNTKLQHNIVELQINRSMGP